VTIDRIERTVISKSPIDLRRTQSEWKAHACRSNTRSTCCPCCPRPETTKAVESSITCRESVGQSVRTRLSVLTKTKAIEVSQIGMEFSVLGSLNCGNLRIGNLFSGLGILKTGNSLGFLPIADLHPSRSNPLPQSYEFSPMFKQFSIPSLRNRNNQPLLNLAKACFAIASHKKRAIHPRN
jgi:hypothetical protein